MALANKPKLLLIDEPTVGMAPKERNELMNLTASLEADKKGGVPGCKRGRMSFCQNTVSMPPTSRG